MSKSGTTGITVSDRVRLFINEVETQEELRLKRHLKHDEFLIFLTKLYKRVRGDTMVLDRAWENVRKEKEMGTG